MVLMWMKVLAFGDGDNDAEMLVAGSFGVAMENAAKYMTLTNNEGGVGAFLERVYFT